MGTDQPISEKDSGPEDDSPRRKAAPAAEAGGEERQSPSPEAFV